MRKIILHTWVTLRRMPPFKKLGIALPSALERLYSSSTFIAFVTPSDVLFLYESDMYDGWLFVDGNKDWLLLFGKSFGRELKIE